MVEANAGDGRRVPADSLRAAAAAAALVLALASHGDALVLAGLLVLAAWRPAAIGAVTPALVAASWRWGSTSLESLAGAQAVLGPAGLVGPGRSAASAWLAAGAILLVAARPPVADAPWVRRAAVLLVAAASGGVAAVVVAGPALGGDAWIRLVAVVLGTALAACVAVYRSRAGRRPVVCDAVAVIAGVGALVLVSPEAPAWSGTVDRSAVGVGATTAVAVVMLAVVGGRAAVAMGQRHP